MGNDQGGNGKMTEPTMRGALKAIELLWEFKRTFQAENIEYRDVTAYLFDLSERTQDGMGEVISSVSAALFTLFAHIENRGYSEDQRMQIISNINEDLAIMRKAKFKYTIVE